ncbi:helix-turn-helix domain-containing protein [Pediococcus pentosaceus]|uniref:helix-turn-helix domain-containing protein n=1 Tax=Pediococcus pentosaceus TaxID=1255 RepID=UPI001E5EF8AE|nr:helix-turn-helix domain-containing protein [Pediococcus pentosaceus]
MEIGTAIKFYRKYQSLSQKDLAEGICSQGEISLIEKGGSNTIHQYDLKNLLKIRYCCGCPRRREFL